MMDVFRKFGESKISKALLTVLIVSFAAWGIGSYLVPTLSAAAVTVNGEGISQQALEQTYKQRLDNVSQLLGTRPTQQQIDQMQLPEQVVTEVVARTALRQMAETLQLQASTKQLQDEISMVSAFKNEQGHFDVTRYRQILQQIGRSPQQFEHDLAQDIMVRQMAQLAIVEMPSPSLIVPMAASEDAELKLDVATFAPADVSNVPEPTAADLEKFYGENKQFYSKPESRDLVVLRLHRDDLTKSITVPEKDVQAAYDANKEAYKLPEKRVVRHILLDSKAEADKVAAGIHNLDDFAKAANAVTKDPGNQGKGGLLGEIQQKDVVPAFGKAAFALAENKLSEPVQSNFGWHLIWVEKITPAKSLTFDETKDAIARDLQKTQAEEAMTRLGGQIDEKVAAGEPLSKIATDLGLKPVQYNMVTANDEAVPPQELEAGFGLAKGEISPPLPQEKGDTAYVQTTDISIAKTLTLAEVHDRAVKDWKSAHIQMALRQSADKLLAATRAPGAQGDLTALAAKAGVTTKVATVDMKTASDAPTWLQRRLLEVYPLAVGSSLPVVMQDGESWHVVRLAQRISTPPSATELPEMAKVYQQRLQGDIEALLMSYVTQQSTVKLSQDHLKQLFGREVKWDVTNGQ